MEGMFLRCNNRFAEIIVYSRDEVPGLDIWEITAPEHILESKSACRRVKERVFDYAFIEKRYICQGGTSVWVRTTTCLQCDSEKDVECFTDFVEDISALKIAEGALRLSEERYRTAFHTSIDAININRLSDGVFIDVNLAFLNIMGFNRDEIIGRSSMGLNIWVNEADRMRLVDELSQKAVCLDLEAAFRRKKGELIWGLMSASINELDDVPCILSVTRDI